MYISVDSISLTKYQHLIDDFNKNLRGNTKVYVDETVTGTSLHDTNVFYEVGSEETEEDLMKRVINNFPIVPNKEIKIAGLIGLKQVMSESFQPIVQILVAFKE